MAVVSCTLDRKTRKASVDQLNIGTYTLRYEVMTNSTMGPQAVTLGALSSSPHPLPNQWQTYSYQGDADALSYARDYDIDGDPDCLNRWWITVQFRPPESGQGSQTVAGTPIMAESNPLHREAVVWWDRMSVSEYITKDKDGKPIQNKAEDLYPDAIEIDKAKGIRVVEVNVATEGEVAYYQFNFDGAVNASEWNIGGTTIPARCAQCQEVSSGPPQTEHGYVYFHLVFRFVFDKRTWDHPMFEKGQFHFTKDAGGEYEMITLSDPPRRKITNAKKIVSLNEDGTRRDDGATETLETLWRIRPEVNFNDLPF